MRTEDARLTSEETLAIARAFGETLGKTMVVTKDMPGFIVNRLLIPYLLHAVKILQDGLATREDIDTAIKLGLNPFGHKQREGDFRTPEGRYELVRRNPSSRFFLSIGISYPNREDRAVASEAGYPPGGLIMIHGQPNEPKKPPAYYASKDWTDGCIAVSNADMIDIWNRAPLGIPIEITP